MSKRVLKIQEEVITRYRRIGNLWTGYYAKCAAGPEIFGGEFFRAIGELLQGKQLEKLELVHLQTRELKSTVFPRDANDREEKQGYNKPGIRSWPFGRESTTKLHTRVGSS